MGDTMFKVLFYIKTMISVLVIVSFSSTALADGTVTENGDTDGFPIDTGARSNCGSLGTVSKNWNNKIKIYTRNAEPSNYILENPRFDSSRNYKYAYMYFNPGLTLPIQSIVGDYAEIVYDDAQGKSHTGYIHKSDFMSVPMPDNPSQTSFEYMRRVCRGEISSNIPDNTEGSLSDSHNLNNNRPSGLPQNMTQDQKQNFDKALCNLRQFYNTKDRKEKFAFVNIPNGYKFKTYVVNLQTNRVVDTFDSLKSPYSGDKGTQGMGCKINRTRPGIFKLSSQMSPGTKRHSWWGRSTIGGRSVKAPAYVITNVGGHAIEFGGGGNRNPLCRSNSTIKAHMNTNMTGASSGGVRYSWGCLITSPQKFEQWTKKLAGDALIVNFDPKRNLHPNCTRGTTPL